MSATIQTTSAVLASGVAQHNPNSVHTVADGVHTVTHATGLVVTAAIARRAGYTDSYSVGPATWAETIRGVVTEGYIALHDLNALVIQTGAGSDAAFVASYGPTGPGQKSRVPVDRDSILIGTWRDLYGEETNYGKRNF